MIEARRRALQEQAPFVFDPTAEWAILRTYPTYTSVRIGTRTAVVIESASGLLVLPPSHLRARVSLSEGAIPAAALVDASPDADDASVMRRALRAASFGEGLDAKFLTGRVSRSDIQVEDPDRFRSVSLVDEDTRMALRAPMRAAIRAQLSERERLYRRACARSVSEDAATPLRALLLATPSALAACVRTGRRVVETIEDPLFLANYHRSLAERHIPHTILAGTE